MKYLKTLQCVLVLSLILTGKTDADVIYTIGNSLTWDSAPFLLDGDPDWHVYCSKNLQYIFDNPTNHCINSSVPWTEALVQNQYDWVMVQPFAGTTLAQDTAVISAWMDMQPNATFVIHPAWTAHATFPADYTAGNPDDMMRPSPEYISDLIDNLQLLHPGQTTVSTGSNDILWSIYQDIQNGIGPFDKLSDLYRDQIHMSPDNGRYLMHNSVRTTLGQPLSSEGFGNLDPEIKSYLDSKLTGIPEPTTSGMLALLMLGLMANVRKRRV